MTTHNMYKTSEYDAWGNMKSNCYNPRARSFMKYGSKGITVCDEWLSDFMAFYHHLGPRPSRKHILTLDDGAKEFSPKTTRWRIPERVTLEHVREQYRKNARNYDERHREKRAAAARARRAANPEYYRQKSRENHEKNREKEREQSRLWSKNNPIKRRANQSKRRMRLSSENSYTEEDVREIFALQRERCAYCKKKLKWKGFHIDHVLPLSSGGGNDRGNIQIACETCNVRKHARDPIEFAQSLGRLI